MILPRQTKFLDAYEHVQRLVCQPKVTIAWALPGNGFQLRRNGLRSLLRFLIMSAFGLGRLHAAWLLTWGLLRAMTARVLRRERGLRRFWANYCHEGLLPISEADRAILPAFSGCIACGLCNVGEGARMASSQGAYPGLMQLVLASSRSMPDYDAAARGFQWVPDDVLVTKELGCPAAIPFGRLKAFVLAVASDVKAAKM